ncbi:MAG: PHP domain-containing protein [Candidatus Aureabacteria bacterium]|nr:PHP domain-containing protein [Candidatus Auribacterota bacterium]
MADICDLHIHTQFSDGIFSPEEIVEMGVSARLRAIAIADHDTVDGIPRAVKAAGGRNIDVIPAVEISADSDEDEVHILGYFIDLNSGSIKSELKRLRGIRVERIYRMTDKLRELGISLNPEEIMENGHARSVGRPHIARALVKSGYVRNISEAFRKFIGEGCPAYVKKEKLSPGKCISFIKDAGGVPVLAHPGTVRSKDVLKDVIRSGIKGIEVYHPDHNSKAEIFYAGLAAQHGLIVTGGSDFHGPESARSYVGLKTVDYSAVEMLEKAKSEK